MNDMITKILQNKADEMISFAQEVLQTRSLTGSEGDVAALVQKKMGELRYDQVDVDAFGNVIGRIGNGHKKLMFDSHMDTVSVVDPDEWNHDPYGGEILDGFIHGRGSCDMKGGLVSSIYGGYIARMAGLPDDVTIMVCATVMEEDYDGEAVRYLLSQEDVLPDACVMCEPSSLNIVNGHNGRALIKVIMPGIPCHGSTPHLGDNPVYKLQEIITRIQTRADELLNMPEPHGSLALTNVSCRTASNNSVPAEAYVILDRRVIYGETENDISAEMDRLVEGTDASWGFVDIEGTTWTGKQFTFHSFLPAVKTDPSETIVEIAEFAGSKIIGKKPELDYMKGTTNAVASSGIYGIPSIIYGPGDLRLAHAKNEHCSVNEIIAAAGIYAAMCLSF